MREQGRVEPVGEYAGYNEPWACRCLECDRDVAPRLANIVKGQGGCRFCAGYVTPQEAADEMREAGFEPQAPFPGVAVGWASVCLTCGKAVAPQLQTVRNGSGCAYCGDCCDFS
jgi:hypothetical protein